MDNIISCVTLEDAEEKFTGWEFWNVCITLKEQPSQKFINFMVKNTDFTSLESDYLICTIIILMRRHSEYLKSPSKGNIVTALEDILGGKEPYQEFSKALLAVPNIEETLKWETIISSNDDEIQYFAYILASNGIKIELNSAGETSKFTVKEEEDLFKEFEDVGEAKLIKLLAKEPELNQWIKDVFTIDMKYVTAGFVKDCSLIGKIDSMEALASAKATAIQSFIEQSKDKDRLQKMYGKLLADDKTELLSSVTLDNKTAEWAIANLMNLFPKGLAKYLRIEFKDDDDNGSIAQLRSFITSWKQAVKDQKNDIKISVSLDNFICLFKNQLNKNDFVKLLDLNIWKLSESTLNGYALSNILCEVKDGCISDKFLKMIKDRKSVDFSNLWSDKDRYFGRCLFDTIYELIRTSENYDQNDPLKQKQAIQDVLVSGERYEWFRNGLKTFFEKAKDKNGRTANDIVVNQILEELPYFKTLLDNCNMELKFDSDQKELRPEAIPEIKMNVKQGEQPQEEQPKEAQPPKEEQQVFLEQKNNKEEGEQNIEIKKKEERLKENLLENLEEDKSSIEGEIIEINTKEEPKEQINQMNQMNQTENGQKLITDTNKGTTQKEKVGDTVIDKYKVERSKEEEIIGGNENDKTKKSKFPTWVKVLIGLGIAAVAVLAALFGFGVLGALAGTALMVARIVAVLAIFAEMIYLAVVLSNMNRTDDGPGGRGSSSGSGLETSENKINVYGDKRQSLLEIKQGIENGNGQNKNPLSESNSEFKIGMTKKDQ